MKKAIFRTCDKQSTYEALRDAPDYVDAQNKNRLSLGNLGLLQAGLAQYGEALKRYGPAIASYDEVLARHEEAVKIYCQAITSFDEGLRRAPDYVYAHNNKGLALQSLGILLAALSKHEEALESYSKAVAAFSRSLKIAPLQTTIRELLEELQRKLDDGGKTRP